MVQGAMEKARAAGGQIKKQPRAAGVTADVSSFWGLWGHLRLENTLRERAVAGTDAQGTCLCHQPAQGSPSPASHFLACFLSHTGFTEMSNSSGWGCPPSWSDSYSCYLIVEGIFSGICELLPVQSDCLDLPAALCRLLLPRHAQSIGQSAQPGTREARIPGRMIVSMACIYCRAPSGSSEKWHSSWYPHFHAKLNFLVLFRGIYRWES